MSSYPLRIVPDPEGITHEESEFNADFIRNLLPKLDWDALRSTASSLGVAELPPAMPDNASEDEEFLKSVHSLVMDVHIMEGSLVCPNCGRAYVIKRGIPNMLLQEDEV